MRKVGLIMSNKVLAQSLAQAINRRGDLEAEPFYFADPEEAIQGIPILGIDVAIVGEIGLDPSDGEKVHCYFRRLRSVLPKGQILILVPPYDLLYRDLSLEILQRGSADDFIFLDASLDYLFAKVASL